MKFLGRALQSKTSSIRTKGIFLSDVIMEGNELEHEEALLEPVKPELVPNLYQLELRKEQGLRSLKMYLMG